MKKKSIFIVLAIIIIAIALLGILYYATDLFKSPKQLFGKYFVSNFELLGENSYEEALKQAKEQSEKNMEVEGEITAKFISDDEDIAQLSQILEKGKIKYNSKTIGKEHKAQNSITLNYNNTDIITLDLLQNNEQYGIKIKEAYDKFISVENNNLKALFEKLGVSSTDIPNKIETIDYYELLKIDDSTLKHINNTYSKVLDENIPEDSYSKEENVTTNINSTEVITNAYKLVLTEQQVSNIMTKVLETLKSDDITLNLIVQLKLMQMINYIFLK